MACTTLLQDGMIILKKRKQSLRKYPEAPYMGCISNQFVNLADQSHELIGGETGHFAAVFVFEPLADLFQVGGHGFDQNAFLAGLYDKGRVWFEPELFA